MTTKIQTFGGNIGIGTTDPGVFKLNVNGSLKTSSLVVNGVTDAQVPIGLLGMWSGSLSSIPSGWKLCNGQTYARTDGGGNIVTPNLVNRFIRGANGNAAPSSVFVGSTGGNNNVTLSAANLAPHSHTVTVNSGNANHGHGPTPATPSTSTNDMGHTHPVGTTQTPHDHGETSTTNTPHNHGTSGDGSQNHGHSLIQGNMPHSHDTETDTGPHRHYLPFLNSISGRPGNQLGTLRTNTTFLTSTYNNDPAPAGHTHVGAQATPQHAHGVPTAEIPHSHNTGGDNWSHGHDITDKHAPHTHQTGPGNAPHTHSTNTNTALHGHTASSGNAGQGTAFSVLNDYYALFYIMKI